MEKRYFVAAVIVTLFSVFVAIVLDEIVANNDWAISLEGGGYFQRDTYIQILGQADENDDGMLCEQESLIFAYLMCRHDIVYSKGQQQQKNLADYVKILSTTTTKVGFASKAWKKEKYWTRDIPTALFEHPNEEARDILEGGLDLILHEGPGFCAATSIGSFVHYIQQDPSLQVEESKTADALQVEECKTADALSNP